MFTISIADKKAKIYKDTTDFKLKTATVSRGNALKVKTANYPNFLAGHKLQHNLFRNQSYLHVYRF